MITINNFQKKPYSTVIEIFTEKKLPKELEQYILSFLGPRDLQSAVQVSKNFKILSINTAKQIEISFLHEFANFLEQHIGNDQIIKICSLGEKNLSNCASLSALKSTNLDLKEEIIDILKTLDKEELLRLKAGSKTLVKSEFFSNMLFLTALYRQMDKLEELDPSPIRDKEFVIICTQLCRKGGNLAKAAEAASKISDESTRTKILEVIDKAKPRNEIDSPLSKKPNSKSHTKTKSNHCIIS
jgi:hypothetical protein